MEGLDAGFAEPTAVLQKVNQREGERPIAVPRTDVRSDAGRRKIRNEHLGSVGIVLSDILRRERNRLVGVDRKDQANAGKEGRTSFGGEKPA